MNGLVSQSKVVAVLHSSTHAGHAKSSSFAKVTSLHHQNTPHTPLKMATSSSMESATHFLEELKDVLVKAFMSAPQMDAHHGARVPVDFGVSSKIARRRVAMQSNDSATWALSPQLPVSTSC